MARKPELPAISREIGGNDLADLAIAELPRLDPAVDRLIVPGLTLLCAKPKVGKSFMLLDILLGCAAGGFALGCLPCKHMASLALMLEDSKRRLKTRTVALLDGLSVPRGCTVFTECRRGDDGIVDLVNYLDDHPEIGLVGIDTLAKFRGTSRDASRSVYQTEYEELAILQTIAQQREISIVVLHHLRKADGDDPMDLVSGTLGITGAADHIIVITGNCETGHKLTLRGRDLPDVAWDLRFDYGRWSILGESAPKRRVLDTVGRIERDVEIVQRHERGESFEKIAKDLGCAKGTAVNAWKKRYGDESSGAKDTAVNGQRPIHPRIDRGLYGHKGVALTEIDRHD
jgi:hypothetical protein